MNCNQCGDDGSLYMHSVCHPEVPTWVVLTGNVLTIECAECEAVVARFTVKDEMQEKMESMGACFNQLMENEPKESLAQMVCDGLDKIATLEAKLLEKDDSLAQARGCANDRFHEIEKLEAELHDEKLAFEHANEVVGKLESELAQAQAEIERLKVGLNTACTDRNLAMTERNQLRLQIERLSAPVSDAEGK